MGVISTRVLHHQYISPEGGEGPCEDGASGEEWGWGCLQGHPFLGRMEKGGEDGGDGCDLPQH